MGTKSEISAESTGLESRLIAGRLKWVIPNKDSVRRVSQTTKQVDQIALTPEVARNIQLTARVFESYNNPWRMIKGLDGVTRPQQRVRRHDIIIDIEAHPELEDGKCYLIKVQTAGKRSLKATFTKVDEQAAKPKDDEKVNKQELQKRMGKMGEALISEGMKNLRLASNGGAPVFNSSSTPADVFAHGMQGVIRAGQHVAPDIKVPHTKPTESAADLDGLSPDELQSRFEEVYKKDQEFEKQRLQASIRGNVQEVNRILEAEMANSQLLVMLGTALEKKGLTAKIPQSAIDTSAQTNAQRLREVEDACKVQ